MGKTGSNRRDIVTRPKATLELWKNDPRFKPFSDRLNFLSPERQHLNTGRLMVLPARNPEKRKPYGE